MTKTASAAMLVVPAGKRKDTIGGEDEGGTCSAAGGVGCGQEYVGGMDGGLALVSGQGGGGGGGDDGGRRLAIEGLEPRPLYVACCPSSSVALVSVRECQTLASYTRVWIKKNLGY